MPRKQRVRVEEDEEDDELPSDLVPSRKIARKLRKQRLKDGRTMNTSDHVRAALECEARAKASGPTFFSSTGTPAP